MLFGEIRKKLNVGKGTLKIILENFNPAGWKPDKTGVPRAVYSMKQVGEVRRIVNQLNRRNENAFQRIPKQD